MDVQSYKQRQQQAWADAKPKMRMRCQQCLQPDFSCFCELIKPFDPKIQFIILIHPIEIARRIATGRMSHLFLKNSQLISGHNFTDHSGVNNVLNNPKYDCMMLYPGEGSANLSLMSKTQHKSLRQENKTLTIFVIDGTWATAKKMVGLSQNLRTLPRICFTPDRPSNFRIRRQPRPECYSTIEAIHQTIDLLNPQTQEHDQMLKAFEKMVLRQLELAHSMTITPWNLL